MDDAPRDGLNPLAQAGSAPSLWLSPHSCHQSRVASPHFLKQKNPPANGETDKQIPSADCGSSLAYSNLTDAKTGQETPLALHWRHPVHPKYAARYFCLSQKSR
ncbi:Uncharacterised protein [Vibrio cholerae]|nr:Uncharacterised protein [Vibrio cholerae]